MLILINLTGLNRTYWLPVVGRRTDGHGLWFLDVRWLGVEVTVYSRQLGSELIRRLNEGLRQPDPAAERERLERPAAIVATGHRATEMHAFEDCKDAHRFFVDLIDAGADRAWITPVASWTWHAAGGSPRRVEEATPPDPAAERERLGRLLCERWSARLLAAIPGTPHDETPVWDRLPEPARETYCDLAAYIAEASRAGRIEERPDESPSTYT